MNNFYKILPKRKSSKKHASSANKRSSSLTEENNLKKINNNSIRLFTTYDEVFEKLNSKINKSGKKPKANSASKNIRKSSFSKKKQTPKKSIERKNLRNIFTYNTNYTTQDTENNKIRYIKQSPKKEKFNEILNKAKDLLSIQSDLVLQCGKLSQNLSKSDLEINTKMKNEIIDNGNNALPGLAKALYLLECKRDNKPINYNLEGNSDIFVNEINNSFYIQILNELNKLIGELGYSYVYNEFDEVNYKKENILIYFNNVHKLINILHQTINEQKELLIKQSNQIKEYEKYLQNYQYNNNLDNSISSKNDNQNIYINENTNQNNLIENNNSNNSLFNNLSSHDFTQLKNCTNVFNNNNGNISQKNTHYFNSYMNNNNEMYQEQIENNLNESENSSNEINKQSLPPEMSNNYLNYYKNQNQNKNMISSMINSESFFESYKRNKELKHNLNYDYNFNEKNVNNE